MKLDLSGNELTQPLTDDLIVKSLESLGTNDDSFLILSKGEMHYMQTVRLSDGTYVLEYRAGSDDSHFECVDTVISLQKTSAAFLSYFHETDDWKTSLRWEPLGSSQEKSRAGRPTFLVIFVVALAFVVSIFLMLSV